MGDVFLRWNIRRCDSISRDGFSAVCEGDSDSGIKIFVIVDELRASHGLRLDRLSGRSNFYGCGSCFNLSSVVLQKIWINLIQDLDCVETFSILLLNLRLAQVLQ